MIRDRVLRGFTAGVIGGVAMNLIDLPSYFLGIAPTRHLDWAGVMLYGLRPATPVEEALSLVAQLMFAGFVGVLFIMIEGQLSPGNVLIRGWLFGLAVWFGLYAVIVLFNVRQLLPLPFPTVATDVISSSAYGLALGYSLRRLESRPR